MFVFPAVRVFVSPLCVCVCVGFGALVGVRPRPLFVLVFVFGFWASLAFSPRGVIFVLPQRTGFGASRLKLISSPA